jgi:hypothetical protein
MWACKAFGMALELGLHRAAPIGGNRLSQVGALRLNPRNDGTDIWRCLGIPGRSSDTLQGVLVLLHPRQGAVRGNGSTVPAPREGSDDTAPFHVRSRRIRALATSVCSGHVERSCELERTRYS